MESTLLHELIEASSRRFANRDALSYGGMSLTYATLQARVSGFATSLVRLGIASPTASASISTSASRRSSRASAPPPPAACSCRSIRCSSRSRSRYILRDCNVRVLVTSPERLALLVAIARRVSRPAARRRRRATPRRRAAARRRAFIDWNELLDAPPRARSPRRSTPTWRRSSTRRAAPASRRASCCRIATWSPARRASRRTSRTAPTTRCSRRCRCRSTPASASSRRRSTPARASCCINYLLPQRRAQRARARARHRPHRRAAALDPALAAATGRTTIAEHLRYFANTGGRMPLRDAERAARAGCRATKPYLMYGLTEAFRSTYLPPEEVDRRPDSIGKAIPNAEILVLREDGTPCAPNEPGELVHRGALVGMGYWNDPEKTAERFKPLPGREPGLVLPEIAVFSGDTVRTDAEGFLYFIGRRDEMIKTSGYRVSPTEVEEVALRDATRRRSARPSASRIPTLGQAIVVVATPTRRRRARRRRAAGRVPRAPAGVHGAGADRRAARARCRATRTARSTARRWRRSSTAARERCRVHEPTSRRATRR